MKAIAPTPITPMRLASSSIAENDYPAYSPDTTYGVHDRVTRSNGFDFMGGVLPSGATLARAAGPWSRTKRVEYTDFRFADGVSPAGAGVARAAGPWSRRGENGALVKGTAANVARFDYDPPVENRLPYSDGTNFSDQATVSYTVTAQSGGVSKVVVGAIGSGDYANSYVQIGVSGQQAFSAEIMGGAGGEIVYLFAYANGSYQTVKRIVLSAGYQRLDAVSPAADGWYIGIPPGGSAPGTPTFPRKPITSAAAR